MLHLPKLKDIKTDISEGRKIMRFEDSSSKTRETFWNLDNDLNIMANMKR